MTTPDPEDNAHRLNVWSVDIDESMSMEHRLLLEDAADLITNMNRVLTSAATWNTLNHELAKDLYNRLRQYEPHLPPLEELLHETAQ